MQSLLLSQSLIERLSQANVITGIVLAAVGLAFTLLAKRITRVVRKQKEINTEDKVYLGVKAFSLMLIFLALIIMVIA